MQHVVEITGGVERTVKAGRRPFSITLDVMVPVGASEARVALAETLRYFVPREYKKYIKIFVEEF